MSTGKSLWGKWIEENLLRKKSFWEVKSKTQIGSWMWRKLLKLRDIAKTFYMKEIGNGRHTFFWYDKWSDRGALIDILGERGIIDMGIGRESTVEEASYLLWIELQDGANVRIQYVSSIWGSLVKGILKETYTNEWKDIVIWISDEKMERMRLFCIRYAFQIALYTLWRERNKVRHEKKLMPIEVLKKLVDKGVRNKLSLMRSKKVRFMEKGLQFWFSTRL
ncbi:uncharacterized protein LOC106425391 [Brassica napus]|uniref:uncharacterized protein LOC106425391 n=1 Tax=Brassica napus TaxID=3708 RepID=UPI0006AA6836|nr:uncharacterized protein LOC106425391 [Brassica napus]